MSKYSQEVHETKRKELLQKSFDLLAARGLENTGMRDLCKACGFATNNSLYYYFGNKDNLIVECIAYGMEKVEREFLQRAIVNSVDLKKFFEETPKLAEKFSKDMSILYQVALSPKYREKIMPMIRQFPQRYDYYAELIAENINCNVAELKPLLYLYITVTIDKMLINSTDFNDVEYDYIYEQVLKICNQKK